MIKIIGERNSSTRALQKLIELNSDTKLFPSTETELNPNFSKENKLLGRAFRLSKGTILHQPIRKIWEQKVDEVFDEVSIEKCWKHSAVFFNDVSQLHSGSVVFVVRNPFSWFVSLYNNPIHILQSKPSKIENFVYFHWKTVKRDNLPRSSYYPISLYCEKLKSYAWLMSRLEKEHVPFKVVKFEDMILSQEKVFYDVLPLLERPTENFTILNQSTKNKEKNLAYYQKYYLSEQWRHDIPHNIISDLECLIDRNTVEFFGYSACL